MRKYKAILLVLLCLAMLAGCGAGKGRTVSFEDYDFSDVTKVEFYIYLYPENTTVVEDPEDVAEICEFLGALVGVNGGSSEGYYGGTYRVDLYAGDTLKDFFFFEGPDANAFQYGSYDDHYQVRYEMSGLTGEEADAFFAQYETTSPNE